MSSSYFFGSLSAPPHLPTASAPLFLVAVSLSLSVAAALRSAVPPTFNVPFVYPSSLFPVTNFLSTATPTSSAPPSPSHSS